MLDYITKQMSKCLDDAMSTNKLHLKSSDTEQRRVSMLHVMMNGVMTGYADTVDNMDIRPFDTSIDHEMLEHAISMYCIDNDIQTLDEGAIALPKRYFYAIEEQEEQEDKTLNYFATQGYISGLMQARDDVKTGIVDACVKKDPSWLKMHAMYRIIIEDIVDDLCDNIMHPNANPAIEFAKAHCPERLAWLNQKFRQETQYALLLYASALLEPKSRVKSSSEMRDDALSLADVASAYITEMLMLMAHMPISLPTIPKEAKEAVSMSSDIVDALLSRMGIIVDDIAVTWAVLAASETEQDGDNVNWHLNANSAAGACIALARPDMELIHFVPNDLMVEFRKICDF
jgi:hypothetical protein